MVRRQSAGVRLQEKARNGGERDRTDDLLLAKQALSQLSYAPFGREADEASCLLSPAACDLNPATVTCNLTMGQGGLEPPTHAYQAIGPRCGPI